MAIVADNIEKQLRADLISIRRNVDRIEKCLDEGDVVDGTLLRFLGEEIIKVTYRSGRRNEALTAEPSNETS